MYQRGSPFGLVGVDGSGVLVGEMGVCKVCVYFVRNGRNFLKVFGKSG